LFCAIFGTDVDMDKFISICRNNDFRRLYAKGKSFVSPLVVVYVKKNRNQGLRVGITTSKKIGNAVLRNRSRRVIREAFRELSPRVKSGYDLVFVARGRTPHVKSTDVRRHMEKELTAAGVLKPAAFSAQEN
jgi:ribonuclease P protein component